MTEFKGPTLDAINALKLRLRTLPDELNVAREAATRLSAMVKDDKAALAEREAEVAAMTRADLLAQPQSKKPTEVALTLAVKAAVEKDDGVGHLRATLREVQLRHEGAELQVKHLTDRFVGLQVYADLTTAEVRLLVAGLGA